MIDAVINTVKRLRCCAYACRMIMSRSYRGHALLVITPKTVWTDVGGFNDDTHRALDDLIELAADDFRCWRSSAAPLRPVQVK